jgi:tetratricopeptide (TPR) repeat protein
MKLSLLVLIILFVAQATPDTGVLQPPRKGLIALHWPDLTKLEAGVREQVTTLQSELTATAKDPHASDAALSEAYGRLAQIYHAYSLTSPARECYLNASVLAPKSFQWIYLLAKLDQQEGRFDDAIRRYQSARTLRPDYVAAYVNLGNIFLELNRLDDARENFESALAMDRDNAAANYGLGQVGIARRDYAAAVKHFEKTLAAVPSATRVHYSLAMAYRGLGETEKARAHLAQQGSVGVRVSDPLVDSLQDLVQGERLFLSRGKVAFEAQRYADAAVEFRKAVAAKPDSVTARVNLGAALVQLADLKGAAEQFGEAIRLEPRNGNAHYNLAVILARQNKHDEAIVQLRSALSTDAQDLPARFLLAQELLKAERGDEAVAEYSRVVQADANNETALLEMVKLLWRKGQFKQALDAIEKGHAQYPQKGRTVVLLSYLLIASPELPLRDGARAVELAQSVYKATGAFQHAALVALALAEAGRCNEASSWQRQAIVAAEQQDKTDLLAKVRAALKRYEGVQTCRPPADPHLTELQFFETSK